MIVTNENGGQYKMNIDYAASQNYAFCAYLWHNRDSIELIGCWTMTVNLHKIKDLNFYILLDDLTNIHFVFSFFFIS